MTKIIYAFMATTIFTITCILAIGQERNGKLGLNEFTDEFAYTSIAKTITKNDNPYSILYKIPIKAARDFMRTYPKIGNEHWELLKDGYVVSFTSDPVWTKNYYDKKGRWLHCIDQYYETKLPRDVRSAVKTIYYDYLITVIQEVNTNKENKEATYFVHLKFGETFKTIKVFEGEIEDVILQSM